MDDDKLYDLIYHMQYGYAAQGEFDSIFDVKAARLNHIFEVLHKDSPRLAPRLGFIGICPEATRQKLLQDSGAFLRILRDPNDFGRVLKCLELLGIENDMESL